MLFKTRHDHPHVSECPGGWLKLTRPTWTLRKPKRRFDITHPISSVPWAPQNGFPLSLSKLGTLQKTTALMAAGNLAGPRALAGAFSLKQQTRGGQRARQPVRSRLGGMLGKTQSEPVVENSLSDTKLVDSQRARLPHFPTNASQY